jgi:hypothetical protein
VLPMFAIRRGNRLQAQRSVHWSEGHPRLNRSLMWRGQFMAFDFDVEELDEEEELTLQSDACEYEEPLEFEEIDFAALGIDPNAPTEAKPGSEEKVLILAARYAAGVPLWHHCDCYEHGPGEALLRMAQRN